MTIRSRPYSGEQDFERVRRLLIESYTLTGRIHNWWLDRWEVFRFSGHASDELTGIRRWKDDVRLWEVVGDDATPARLVGVVNPEDGGDFFIQIHPDYGHLEKEMVTWAETRRLACRPQEADPWTLNSFVYEHDHRRAALLQRRGYVNLGHCGYTRSRTLDAQIPDAPLPAGFSVRNVRNADQEDLQKRAEVANAAFNSTRNTPERLQVLHRAPTYREDLDLVVVAPDGAFVSYCVIWFGAENRLGWYEPVGTHPAYRRRGLAKAMMAAGLRKLKALGAAKAYVGVGTDQAANRLYESLGFAESEPVFHWQKVL